MDKKVQEKKEELKTIYDDFKTTMKAVVGDFESVESETNEHNNS